jgi:Sulfotransferase domain
LAAAYPDAKILLTDRDPEGWWDSHVEMFKRGAEADHELTDEQRQWAEESCFARMQTALGTIAPAIFDGRVFDKEFARAQASPPFCARGICQLCTARWYGAESGSKPPAGRDRHSVAGSEVMGGAA